MNEYNRLGMKNAAEEMSDEEKRALGEGVRAVSDGPFIPDIELSAIVGYAREEAKRKRFDEAKEFGCDLGNGLEHGVLLVDPWYPTSVWQVLLYFFQPPTMKGESNIFVPNIHQQLSHHVEGESLSCPRHNQLWSIRIK